MSKPNIEEVGFAAAKWWRLEKAWQRRSAADKSTTLVGGGSRDLVGKAYQELVDLLNAHVGDPPQTINDEEGD